MECLAFAAAARVTRNAAPRGHSDAALRIYGSGGDEAVAEAWRGAGHQRAVLPGGHGQRGFGGRYSPGIVADAASAGNWFGGGRGQHRVSGQFPRAVSGNTFSAGG